MLTSEKISLYGAGRTDAGVHAFGQVGHFEIKKNIELNKIRDGLNQHLRPNPIAILNVEKVDENFHSRFSAKLRSYKYRIVNRRSPLTIDRNRAWAVYKKLNIKKIIYEANNFIGKHNLAAFRSINCQSKTTTKTIESINVNYENNELDINISAKSFLHSQVRIMVGTLIEIGKGKIKESISDIIKSKDRSRAGMTAPAHGLYLIKVR
jgi:pseudouridylate synthase I